MIVIGVFVALIAIAAVVISVAGSDEESSQPGGALGTDAEEVERTFADVSQSGTFLGDPNAPTVVTEFVDLQCPFCGEFATNAIPEVVETHVRSGEVALELRVISFLGEDSRNAAEVAAAAAEQNRLWQFAELFFLNQGPENSGYVTEDFLTEIAGATPGLDGAEALEQRSSPAARALMEENEALASRLGVDSTPSFFVSVEGSQPQPLELDDLTADAFAAALVSAPRGE